MATNNSQWLVITDLDGTFLNHHDYSYQACLPTLKKLDGHNIPVIFNTSKTYSETIELQKQLDITAPFIVENGSAVFLPVSQFTAKPDDSAVRRDAYWQIIIGETLQAIHEKLKTFIHQLPDLMLLSKSTPEQVTALTGLDNKQAVNAINREFSEPILLTNGRKFSESFIQQINETGLTTLQGGRFLHVLGNCDKGKAMAKLACCYEPPARTIALGDSANDVAMLLQADIPVVVKAPGNPSLLAMISPPFITESRAPDGWAEGIGYALSKLNEVK